MGREGVEIQIRGVVQGVGFRPHVFRLAERYGLSGAVSNTSFGVLIEAQGEDASLRAFLGAIEVDAPPNAVISLLEVRPGRVTERSGFVIRESEDAGERAVTIPPDLATCPDCLREIGDPGDRRFRYPFTNCTNCGPRFTILEEVPYDRERTSMKIFPMCPACSREYGDVRDRRFHAEPNACPVCGPRLFWQDDAECTEAGADGPDALREAARAIASGRVVAVKGLGGFHLAVDAASDHAVGRLRQRKRRPSKPLAVMVRDLESARRIALVGDTEAGFLSGPERPIVLLPRREDTRLSRDVAPGIGDVGLMLPYTPLHHLLFACPETPEALVMTSGNAGGEPICIRNEEALERLSGIADAFLLHDREIVTRADDSILRVVMGMPCMIRRSRGYVPGPVPVPWDLPPLLACGGDLKNTFAIAKGRAVHPGPHMGDLDNPLAVDAFEESVSHMEDLLDIRPEAVVADLHPDCAGARYGASRGLPVIRVQHHHAHAVSVMAEHGLSGPVIAVVLDGTGYGPDGTVWGGEILLATPGSYRRLAHLSVLPLPGGDRVAREPWRMGLSALYGAFGRDIPDQFLQTGVMASVDQGKREAVMRMMEARVNAPSTSSCGRLFDAVGALLGLRAVSEYEGQTAMELEAIALSARDAGTPADTAYPPVTRARGDLLVLDSAEMIRGLALDIGRAVPPPEISFRFHCWLARGLAGLAGIIVERTGLDTVVLGGGCFQNRLLVGEICEELSGKGLSVYTGLRVPVNDGGLSLGQAVIGGTKHVSCGPHARDRA